MTASNIRQQILEHIEALPSEQVKTLLLTWLTGTSEDLEDFERLLTNQHTKIGTLQLSNRHSIKNIVHLRN